MFNKEKFALIIRNINSIYENQTSFADASGVNRTYLSRYMNLKLDSPPTPKILKGIANASKGTTTYEELMIVCGYLHGRKTSTSNKSKLQQILELANGLNIKEVSYLIEALNKSKIGGKQKCKMFK